MSHKLNNLLVHAVSEDVERYFLVLTMMMIKMMISKMITRPPAAVKEAAVIGSKVGAAMEGARRARQAKKIKPWSKTKLKLEVKLY